MQYSVVAPPSEGGYDQMSFHETTHGTCIGCLLASSVYHLIYHVLYTDPRLELPRSPLFITHRDLAPYPRYDRPPLIPDYRIWSIVMEISSGATLSQFQMVLFSFEI